MGTVVEHRGAGVAWLEAGAGDALVFLHGLGGTSTAWAPQFDELSGGQRCVAWDRPGYGNSDPIDPPDAMTFEWVADRLDDLLDALAVDRADLVGLSLGGMHALHTALRHAAATSTSRSAIAPSCSMGSRW